jgi:hypothetical protein
MQWARDGREQLAAGRPANPSVGNREGFEFDVLDAVTAKLRRCPLRRLVVSRRSGQSSSEAVRQLAERGHRWPGINGGSEAVRDLLGVGGRFSGESEHRCGNNQDQRDATKNHDTTQERNLIRCELKHEAQQRTAARDCATNQRADASHARAPRPQSIMLDSKES